MTTAYDIVIRPVMTEKTTEVHEPLDQVVFRVKFEANKPQIKAAVEKLFDVKVDRVNTMIVAGKPKRVGRFMGRRKAWKKAIVQLAEGEMIDFYALEAVGEEHGVV
jgi:large subunit ribosomal protein L23